jgi:nucleotide-binding universal stress UspA family protein
MGMMPPRSILIAVDFSEPSRVALEFAARLSRQCEAMLHVLHVENPLLTAAARAEGIDLTRETREELTRFTATATAIEHSTLRQHVVTGEAPRAICDIAQREQVDLIVMGMHGMSGAAHALFGSTTEGVLEHSDTPVFVVPDTWTPPLPSSKDLSGMGPVIAAVEITCPAMAGAEAAARLAHVLHTTLHAVHVVPALNVLERWKAHADAAVEQQITTARQEITTALAGVLPHHHIPLLVESGSVPERLAAATFTWTGQHPILVLGRHARGSRRGVPGSTAYRVLGLAKVPVLVHCLAEGCP